MTRQWMLENKRVQQIAISLLLSTISLTGVAQDHLHQVELLSGTSHFGQTAPMIGSPFAMTQWTPETRPGQDKCVAPYYFDDKKLTGIRGTHWLSGGCATDYGSFTIMPTTGPLFVSPAARSSRYDHGDETMNPGYYSVLLARYNTKIEVTGLKRSGMMRITYPARDVRRVLVEPNAKPGEGYVQVRPASNEIVGYNPAHSFYLGDEPAGFSGFFVIRFSSPITTSGTWCDLTISPDKSTRDRECDRVGGFAEFAASEQPLVLRIGTSFTSVEAAARNLDDEVPDWNFERSEHLVEQEWKDRLHRIEVEGGDETQQRIFYTALYHASLVPRLFSDVDGTYPGFAHEGQFHRVHGDSYYDDFSSWDTFRAFHPLLTILDPVRDQEMVRSLVLKGEQGGYLPSFPLANNFTKAMVGDHTAPIIVDAWAKGLRDFDMPKAFAEMLKNATTVPSPKDYAQGRGRRGIASYLQKNYIPLEDEVLDAYHPREQVSRTLEYAYDDFTVGLMASEFGSQTDSQILKAHSTNWRNVFDPNTTFVRGRHSDGTWVKPFDPAQPADFVTEETPFVASFFVPQDIDGLMSAMGGKEKFVRKLDQLFDDKLYDHGNEPSHHIAYLYNYAGVPSKTQMRVRQIMASEYQVGPGGLSGNDDAGQMSAWYIFSALGFYPVTPGIPVYSIGSPIFSKAVIQLEGGRTFTILAHNQAEHHAYVVDKKLNGHPLSGWSISHKDIIDGGTLNLEMNDSIQAPLSPSAPSRISK